MTSSLRVLMVGPYPLQHGMVVGGVEAVVSTLAPALAAQERVAQVTVLCFHRGQIRSHVEKINDKLQILFVRGQRRPLLTRSLVEVWHARRVARRVNADIVHGQGINAQGEAAIKSGRPPIVTVHGMVNVEARMASDRTITGRFRTKLVDDTVRRVLDRAKVVISISKYDATSLTGLIKGQHVTIPNPIAPEFFIPSYESQGNRILFAGTMVRRKNIEGLLDAFALVRKQVPDARLVLVGPPSDPAYVSEITARMQQLQLADAVDLVGHVENARLLEELRACRVLTLFSHEETLPTIIAQALAIGKPVVASRVGGVAEMVMDDENGFTVEPNDEQALAERLVALLRSEELCRTIGAQGHSFALRQFEPSAVASQTVNAYDLARQAMARPAVSPMRG